MKHSLTTFLLALLLGASSCTASSDKPATGKSGQNDTETVINNIMRAAAYGSLHRRLCPATHWTESSNAE